MAAAALLAFSALRARRRETRRQMAQARCYHVYMALLRSLHAWQAAAQEARLLRLRLDSADAHWRQRVLARALAAWRGRARRCER